MESKENYLTHFEQTDSKFAAFFIVFKIRLNISVVGGIV